MKYPTDLAAQLQKPMSVDLGLLPKLTDWDTSSLQEQNKILTSILQVATAARAERQTALAAVQAAIATTEGNLATYEARCRLATDVVDQLTSLHKSSDGDDDDDDNEDADVAVQLGEAAAVLKEAEKAKVAALAGLERARSRSAEIEADVKTVEEIVVETEKALGVLEQQLGTGGNAASEIGTAASKGLALW